MAEVKAETEGDTCVCVCTPLHWEMESDILGTQPRNRKWKVTRLVLSTKQASVYPLLNQTRLNGDSEAECFPISEPEKQTNRALRVHGSSQRP